MNAQQKTAVDVVALLTEAGDPNAPDGTRARMLADAGAAVAELIKAHKSLLARAKEEIVDPEDVWEIEYAEAALARFGGAA